VSESVARAPGHRLAVEFCGVRFQNPILLAAGTAAYGEELNEVVNLDRLGGVITKAVSLDPRFGAPAPRVYVGAPQPGVVVVKGKHEEHWEHHDNGKHKGWYK